MNDSRTSIEKIKAFHSVKGYLSTEEQSDLQQKLKISDDDLKRLSGLDAEKEFILMLYMLDTANEILGFEEGIARLTNISCPDLYVELKNNKRICIEIKENNINMTLKGIEKSKSFAKKIGAEDLYIAVKQEGVWALYESDYVYKRKPQKINFSDDFKHSQMDNIFNNPVFFMPNGLSFECTYNKDLKDEHLSQYLDFGSLESLNIKYKDNIIFKTTKVEEANYVCFHLENLISACSNDIQKIEEIDDNKTKVIDLLQTDSYIPLSNFLLEPVLHTIKFKSEKFDFSSFLQHQFAKKDNIKKLRAGCLDYLELLKKSGYPIEKVQFN